MARKRGGFIEDLYDIAAMIPWWAGVALAVVAFVLLHLYGSAPAPARVPGQPVISPDVFLKPLANVFKYVLPIALLAGAAASAMRQLKRQGTVREVAMASTADVLHDMSWQEFEALVSEAFKLRGFAVEERGGPSADGGVDLVLRRGNDKYFVQSKQWRAAKVGVVPIRELYGVMAAEGAAGGYFVTSGLFTEEVKAFAAGRNLELVDGQKLFKMFDDVRASVAVGNAAPRVQETAPRCPNCGFSMVRRTARKGSHAGTNFWGCALYPKCRGTRPM